MSDVHEYSHRYGGVTFRIDSDGPVPFIQRRSQFRDYEIENVAHDVRFNFQCVEQGACTLPAPSKEYLRTLQKYIPHQGGPDIVYSPLICHEAVRTKVNEVIKSSENVSLIFHHEAGMIADFDHCHTDLFYLPQFTGLFDDIYVGFNTYSLFLPVFSAATIHSAGVVRKGSGILFLAPDEGGKTTIAKSGSLENVVLSDDQNIVRKHKDKFYLYSTPWGLMTNEPHKSPLTALFMLHKAKEFRIELASQQVVLAYLWNEHSNYLRLIPKNMRKRIFEVFWDLTADLPIYQLHFSKNHVDWDAIDKTIEERYEA